MLERFTRFCPEHAREAALLAADLPDAVVMLDRAEIYITTAVRLPDATGFERSPLPILYISTTHALDAYAGAVATDRVGRCEAFSGTLVVSLAALLLDVGVAAGERLWTVDLNVPLSTWSRPGEPMKSVPLGRMLDEAKVARTISAHLTEAAKIRGVVSKPPRNTMQ